MTIHNSEYIKKLIAAEMIHGDVCGGHIRLFRSAVDLSALTIANGDVVNMLKLPNRGQLVAVRFGSTVTFGTTTVKVGTETDDDVLRAAATKTDCKPEELILPFMKCEGQTINLTIATADAPTSGYVYVDAFVADV